MYNIAVILAGGLGTRLFPLSRTNYPKQFLRIFNGKSLLQLTYERISGLNLFNQIWICTNRRYTYLVKRDIESINDRLILEEKSKNTAYAILYSCFKVLSQLKAENCNFIFFPSDHFVFNQEEFDNSVRKLLFFLNKYDKTFIVGIKPTFPSTEYGYVRKNQIIEDNLFTVARFVEKPSRNRAKYYLRKGNYLWNSGIYAFKFRSFINDFYQHNKDLIVFDSLDSLIKNIDLFPNISIDYLYSQKTKNLAILESYFEWSDLGSFEEIVKISNYFSDRIMQIDSNVNIIFDESEGLSNKRYCFIDVKDLIVVDTADFQLISKKGKTKKISKVLTDIPQEQKDYCSFDFRPWGYYREIEKTEGKYRIKNIVIYPYQELSLQYHNHRDEYWIILSGFGKLIIDNTSIDIYPKGFFHIPKGKVHKVINLSPDNMEIIEVQVGEILSENDIVRLKDRYERI
ncbi:MAG: sugar phosphate nucleotidyltransferase [Candidatus Calescibacterium sp.]|nr:sugar phosphate nucleotidyltransferase [Candidatus Calescibacterium sp.]MCX7971969.1 sugar phosphate nucleotidyltransferase [bacterium]MDW8195445.1 sugar phosphate nucleotidyltransferase [Candidatus Calescibacterium sp.]